MYTGVGTHSLEDDLTLVDGIDDNPEHVRVCSPSYFILSNDFVYVIIVTIPQANEMSNSRIPAWITSRATLVQMRGVDVRNLPKGGHPGSRRHPSWSSNEAEANSV